MYLRCHFQLFNNHPADFQCTCCWEDVSSVGQWVFLVYGLRCLMTSISEFSWNDSWSIKQLNKGVNTHPISFTSWITIDLIPSSKNCISLEKVHLYSLINFGSSRDDQWMEQMNAVFGFLWNLPIWHSMITNPDWVFFHRKPHPFGIEYHTLYCTKFGTLTQIRLIVGRDCPQEM